MSSLARQSVRCQEWQGEQGEQGEQEDVMEMGEVKQLIKMGKDRPEPGNLGEMNDESGSRCRQN